jgi:hydroxymethylpyrimidine pyrophosphatase-like HAD family hydrolase
MARRLNRLVSIVLSAALVVLSAGIDAQQAAAQTITGRAAPVSPMPQLGLGISNAPMPSLALPALSLMSPSLSAPSALTSAPMIAAPAALKAASPAAAIAEKVMAAAPALQALAKPETAGSAASVAGQDLENILTGAKAARSSELSEAVAGIPSALTPNLAAPSAAPEAPKTPEVPAAAPAPFKSIASASSYSAHRLALKAIAVLTGAVFTLPQAGPALTAKIIASAADKALVLSDFDDTLAGYNEVLPSDKIEAVRKIRAAGKHFAVISDRGDVKRPNSTQLTVFESLESIPVADRVGMYVAANSGGKVYKYDEQGVPQKVHEAEALEAEKLEHVQAAAAATKARLSEVGAEQHVADSKNPAESYNTYGYAMMLKPGSSEDSVRGAAAILSAELATRGIEVEVNPRFAKDPANPPYITFSIITKADAAAYIAKALKIEAKDALIIGDAMFVPREAKKAGWLSRLGERLSGRPQVKTGNETDRNMTKNLPGVLTLGVGAAMDPRVANGWALDGKGPVVTQRVLESVASKARRIGPTDDGDKVGTAIQLGMLAGIVGMGALGWYALATALGDIVRMGEEALRNWQASPFGQDAGFFLGATTLGMAGMMGPSAAAKAAPKGLTHAVEPNELYALALEKMEALAVGSTGKIKFLSAVHESRSFNGAWVGDEWRFFFGVGGADGGVEYMVPARRTMISETMMDAFEPQLKGTVSAERMSAGISASYFNMGVKTAPDAALGAVAGVTRVSLMPRTEPGSGDKDLWYSLQDSRDELASVNARTGEVRMEAPKAPSGYPLKNFLLWLGLVGVVAAIYGGFFWAGTHAPVAVPQVPEGWQGPIPTIDDVFRGMGGFLGLGALAGMLKPGAKKPKLTDDDIAASAKSVVASKGGIWSQTEYNMGYYNTLESLKERGATKAQLELFKKLCDEAPVKGGRFNPWSGD